MSKIITTTLEKVCSPEKGAIISGPFGSNISSKYFVKEGIPVIRGNNLSLSLDKFYDRGFVFITEEKADELNCYADKLDLIFTSAGTIGQVGLIPETSLFERYVISNKQIRARVDTSKIDILYAYYWFASPWIQKLLLLSNKGSTVPLLTLLEVKNLPISYPEDIKEQHKIALVLEGITNKIQNNYKINSELESMAKTIYDYWFLQFEFPNEEGKPYKSSGGKMVWNEELKQEIPEGWQIGKLNRFIKLDKGGDWGKGIEEVNYTKKVTCLRGADFPAICGNAKLNAPERYIHEKNSFKILNDGDLIIEISGGSPTQSTGRVCYINNNTLKRFKNEIITSNFCKAICLVDKEYMYWFYILWCKLYENGVFFKYEGKTTGIKNLLFEMLCADYLIVVPNV
ncbi:MAG: hypothetical protein HDR18_13955, partial [Lachnospiraceae bacterium]|nr:hypothetical protein [Lachnospiraceae bacterium]